MKIGGSLIFGNGMPSWKDVGIAALEGAVAGGVAAAMPGAAGAAAGIAKRIVGAAIQGAKVGAVAGAAAGAAASITRQYCEKGKVEVKQVIKDAGEGAIIGAIAGAIVGAAGQAIKEAKNGLKGQGAKPNEQPKPTEQPKPAEQPKANPAEQPKPMGDGLPDTSGEANTPPLTPPPPPRGVVPPPTGKVQNPWQGPRKPISGQQQDGHVRGTPQWNNRMKQGKPTSTFDGTAEEADELVQEAWARGIPVPGNPNQRILEFGKQIGTDMFGRPQTRVRVHQNSRGQIHGYPDG